VNENPNGLIVSRSSKNSYFKSEIRHLFSHFGSKLVFVENLYAHKEFLISIL